MSTEPEILIVGKLDAARRQLETAITLWFNDGDPVSIHSLAYAAYEVIHFISKKRNPERRDLLFDSLLVKPEYRIQFADAMKGAANFFKHAKKDGDSTVEFRPKLSELFILFSVIGIQLAGEETNVAERAFIWWLQITKPNLLTDSGKEMLAKAGAVKAVQEAAKLPKRQFFSEFLLHAKLNRR